MKRLIGYTAVLCLLALTVGCGGVTSSGTLAYISNSNGTGFTVFTVNTNGTLTLSSVSPQPTTTPPLEIQFSPNGKWAYFIDNAATVTPIAGNTSFTYGTGSHLYAYLRAGNGTLSTLIGTYPVSGASSLVVAPNSTYLYIAEPSVAISGGNRTGELAVYSIDQSTGILSQADLINVGYSITQMVMAPGGSLLFGLAPAQQTVVSWTLNSSSGLATQAATLPVGSLPDYMVLSTNGDYMYILDAIATTPNYPNVSPNAQPNSTSSPNFYAYTVGSNGILQTINGSNPTPGVFNENADLQHGLFPTNPVAGVTSNDSRFLFIVNQGSNNISVFKLATTTGEPTEVLGDLVTAGGITTSTASPFSCVTATTACSGPSFAAVAKSNNALYVLDESAGRIFQFGIDLNSGVLRSLNPAFVSAESPTSAPTWITIR
jgi:hypothetical protein